VAVVEGDREHVQQRLAERRVAGRLAEGRGAWGGAWAVVRPACALERRPAVASAAEAMWPKR
jgi:hypothetical protein